MTERNLLVTAKADRENELVRTIIQISSAALLLIPAIVSSNDVSIPRLHEAILFYFGLGLVGLSLLLAIAEQHLSSVAYDRQIAVVFDYYTKKSDRDHDATSLWWVRWSRRGAMVCFGIGIILSAIGIATLI